MVIVGPDGTVTRARPQFHATFYTSLNAMRSVFGKPDLAASSAWFLTLERDGGHGQQLILVADKDASGFDPAWQPDRRATWHLVSDSTQPAAHGALAPALAPVLAAASARPKLRLLASLGPADNGGDQN